ncbi:Cdc6/Cdc18 family protein [Haloarcula sebkhae]|uniref:Cdc6/Cdc18 family protein n=2 Tax=Haloarcula sebkhae TaxID=932660 RepID=A0ACC6VJK3_9EURY|nr:AAA family ATPase [Haloarcula sebkhae]GGK74354.1 cell division control protein Cdc6 [Haloarcula sebkhae]
MIADRSVFDDCWSPQRLRHRDAEVDRLTAALAPAKCGEQANDLLIEGSPGVGKTVLARHTLDRVSKRHDLAYTHVECMGASTAGIIREALATVGPTPATNTPLEDLCLSLRERVDEPLVVVLDEASDIHDTKALDRLADVDGISLVIICYNADEWLAHAPGRITRRLHGQTLTLDRYGVTELADILEPRAEKGLKHGVVSRRQLETIANEVAGVARYGIYSLLAAAELAQDRGHYTVRDEDVAGAYPLAQEWMRQAALDSLSYHHHVLYALVRDAGRIEGQTLHDRYDAVGDRLYDGRSQTPLAKRSQRRKLRKLADYNLIETLGSTRDRAYAVVDESVRSGYDIDVTVVPGTQN